jgi:hypothetical protein
MSADSRLRASLRAEGMFNPLVCTYDPHDDGQLMLVTLWRELHHPTVDVVLVSHTLSEEFPCEELELSSDAVERKFAPGWIQITLEKTGLGLHMRVNEFQF